MSSSRRHAPFQASPLFSGSGTSKRHNTIHPHASSSCSRARLFLPSSAFHAPDYMHTYHECINCGTPLPQFLITDFRPSQAQAPSTYSLFCGAHVHVMSTLRSCHVQPAFSSPLFASVISSASSLSISPFSLFSSTRIPTFSDASSPRLTSRSRSSYLLPTYPSTYLPIATYLYLPTCSLDANVSRY